MLGLGCYGEGEGEGAGAGVRVYVELRGWAWESVRVGWLLLPYLGQHEVLVQAHPAREHLGR